MPAITTIKMRRGTAASWASTNPVLAAGEPGLETDTKVLKFGDGTTAWASLAPALSGTYAGLAPVATQTATVPGAGPWLKAVGSGTSKPFITADWGGFSPGVEFPDSPRVLEITDRGDIRQQGNHLISGSMERNFPVTMLECASDLNANDTVCALVANFASQYLIAGGTTSGVYFGVDALGTIKWANGVALPSGPNVAPVYDTTLAREAAGALLLNGQLRIQASGSTASTALTVDGKSGQTTNFMAVRDSAANVYMFVHPTDGVGMLAATVGSGGGVRVSGAMLSVTPGATNSPGIIVKRVAGQTAKLLQVQSDAGTQLAGFDSSGKLTLGTTAMDAGASLNIENADGSGTVFNFTANSNLIRGATTRFDTNVGFKVAPVATPQSVSAAATDPASTQTLANSLRAALIAYGLAA